MFGERMLKKLEKIYEADSSIDAHVGDSEITMITNENGQVIKAFVGKRNSEGKIKGLRYIRVFVKDSEGNVVRDHWDCKGKCS